MRVEYLDDFSEAATIDASSISIEQVCVCMCVLRHLKEVYFLCLHMCVVVCVSPLCPQ